MPNLGPRVVVAGTHSGVGKTTIATGLMAALRRRGLRVAAAKVGPDFIDPGYHGIATGRAGRNLDAWICGEDVIAPLAARAMRSSDVLVVEGVMGLFDGAEDGRASTAHVARLLDAPIVLVVDASAMSDSVAAVVHGFTTFDPTLPVAGVILNHVGSDGHETMLRDALAPLRCPVVGVLRRDDRLTWRDRHLGLVPVVERPDDVLRSVDALAAAVERSCDVDALLALARAAPDVRVDDPPAARARDGATPVRVAVASGPAFSFVYPDTLELLEQAGAELVPFDPLVEPSLPDGVVGLVAGGGFPEVYAEGLAGNGPLLADVRTAVERGLVTWAECGGLLWLARSLDGRRLAGVVPTDARMTERVTLGYRTAVVAAPSGCPVGSAGTELRGHEFHYSTTEPAGDALALRGRHGEGRGGFASATLLASYLHLHIAGRPELAERFVTTAMAAATAATTR